MSQTSNEKPGAGRRGHTVAFSASYKKTPSQWENGHLDFQVFMHPHHLGSSLLCLMLISEGHEFFKESEKNDATCHLHPPCGPVGFLPMAVGRQDGGGEGQQRIQDMKWRKLRSQRESKGAQHISKETPNSKVRESAHSLPAPRLPHGSAETGCLFLGPNTTNRKAVQLLCSRAPEHLFHNFKKVIILTTDVYNKLLSG